MTSSKYCYKVRGKHGVKTVQKWRVSFFLDGKRYQRSGFATKKEARDAEQKLREQIANMVQATRFDDLCADYLDHSRAYNTSEYARDKELRISTKLIPMFEGLSIQQITSDMIGRVILAIAKHRGPVTANRDLVLLKSIFNHAIERDLLEKNPCNKIKPLPVQHKKQSLPSADDINRVLACLIPDRRDMVQIIMGTMARGIEVISRLTWDDIKSSHIFYSPAISTTCRNTLETMTQRLASMSNKWHQLSCWLLTKLLKLHDTIIRRGKQ